MRVRVLLFARYAERAGSARIEIDAEAGATLATLWDEIRRRYPALSAETEPLMAMDRTYAPSDREVRPGAEIAFFPPVSGG